MTAVASMPEAPPIRKFFALEEAAGFGGLDILLNPDHQFTHFKRCSVVRQLKRLKTYGKGRTAVILVYMDRTVSRSDVDFPEVIWRSSIPDAWARIFQKRKNKTRPETSKSVRTIKKSPPQLLDAFDQPFAPLEHLYYPYDAFQSLGSSRVRQQSASKQSPDGLCYTVKYLGITNGEIGILSQRRPLASNRLRPRTTAFTRPHTSQLLVNMMPPSKDPGDQLTTLTTPLAATSPTLDTGTKDTLPEEYLRPNPNKYDEFLVHRYSRPHQLSPVKKSEVEKLRMQCKD
jgi:hypothetical protein